MKIKETSPRALLGKRERQRRLRARQARGEFCVMIEIGPDILSFLVRSRWLSEVDTGDLKKIAAAVGAMLSTSARV
jgi:hypothetical protein